MSTTPTLQGGIPAEVELVVRAVRPRIDSDDEARILAIMQCDLDWNRLCAYAGWHRVLPMMQRTLMRLGPELVPEDIRGRLAANADATTRNNLIISAELMRLIRLFEEAKLPMIPFKGPVLAQRVYGNLALRPFTDLDLLVRADDAGRAEDLLIKAGFRPVKELAPGQRAAYIRYEHDRSFVKEETGVPLELHWRFFARYVAFKLAGEDMWRRLERVQMAGVDAPMLPPEELLLVLSVHGAKHLWTSLGWILDIALLPDAYRNLDWDRTQELARQTGTERMFRLALRLADDLWGIPMPENIRAQVFGDGIVGRLAMQVFGRLSKLDQPALTPADGHRFYLDARERLRDRIHYHWLWLFTPNYRDQTFISIPGWLSPLHYIVRPIRMTIDFLRRER